MGIGELSAWVDLAGPLKLLSPSSQAVYARRPNTGTNTLNPKPSTRMKSFKQYESCIMKTMY